jgi:hypothetical protein
MNQINDSDVNVGLDLSLGNFGDLVEGLVTHPLETQLIPSFCSFKKQGQNTKNPIYTKFLN